MKLKLALVFALVSGCSLTYPKGYGSSNECIDSDDCKKSESCFGPTSSNCGIQQTGECWVGDAESCAEDQVCKPLSGGCSDTSTGNCVADCRVNGCGSGRCNETSGLCQAIPCNEEGAASCPELFECTNGQGGGPSGCARISCDRDSDCPGENTCWKSLCYDRASRCQQVAP